METSYIIIGLVIIGAIVLIAYLIRQNQKDEKEVTKFFNRESSNFHDEESEFNDEK